MVGISVTLLFLIDFMSSAMKRVLEKGVKQE
jgi:hypothetical protein